MKKMIFIQKKKYFLRESSFSYLTHIELTLFDLSTNGSVFLKDPRELKCGSFKENIYSFTHTH
jgi:hypothetical protein